MLGVGEFADIVGLIYDCALDPECWPEALARITQTIHFHNAALSLMDTQTGTTALNITSGIEEPWLGRMAAYTPDVFAQWGGVERLYSYPLEEPLVLTWVNPGAASAANRYYREWARPQRIIDLMGIGLARDGQMIGTIGLGRHESAGPIGMVDVDNARLIIPHLQRAVAISRLLDLRRLTANSMEAVLRQLSTPVVIVAATGHIVWLNPAADEMLGTLDALSIRASRLVLHNPAAHRAFGRALTALAGSAPLAHGAGCDIPLRTGDGRLLSLYVLPLPTGPHKKKTGARTAAIFIGPHGPQRDPGTIMAALFGLTRTERRVLSRVAEGGTVADIARGLGVGEATIRTHLVRLFDKTGVHRQAELAALFHSFTFPVRPA